LFHILGFSLPVYFRRRIVIAMDNQGLDG